jgi:RimJ/RimL family protein N-acetyltransferase
VQKFDLQPDLKGALIQLRPLRTEDFEALFSVSSDPLLWELHPERLRYKREVFRVFFDAAIQSKGALLAIDGATQEVIGSSRYSALNLKEKNVEVGYTFLSRKCWGKGFNREMKSLMLAHAFQYVDKVFFFVGEKNFRSRKAMEKLGAKLMEISERQPKEGAQYFACTYAIEKSEFLK